MRARAGWVALVVGVALMTSGCPSDPDGPRVVLPEAPTSSEAATSAPPPGPSLPRITRPASEPPPLTATPTATSEPVGAVADLDGDGTLDRVEVAGATVTARLSTTGQVESVGLPEDAVGGDVEVLGRSDLDGDGVDEALVRTLGLPNGDVRVVLRLESSGLELLTTEDGGPFELGRLGGNSGRRSYDCVEAAGSSGREVRVLDAERDGDLSDGELTFTGLVTRWSVSGPTATVVGTERVTAVPAEAPALELDPSTCEQ